MQKGLHPIYTTGAVIAMIIVLAIILVLFYPPASEAFGFVDKSACRAKHIEWCGSEKTVDFGTVAPECVKFAAELGTCEQYELE